MKSYKILIVDDDKDWQQTILRTFKKVGYSAEIVATGEEALKILKELDFDLVILDLRIPYSTEGEAMMRTGVEILKEIYKTSSGIPIIAVSAYGASDVQAVADSIYEGAFSFIEKGKMSSKLLVNRVEKIFEKSLDMIISDKFPTPFAYIYREIKSGSTPIKRFLRWMNLFEILLCLSTFILISEYFEKIKKRESFYTTFRIKMEKPGLGDWFDLTNQFLRVKKELGEGIFGRKIIDFFTRENKRTIPELIEIRNTYVGHGSQQLDYEYKNLADKCQTLIMDSLRGLKFLADFRLSSVASLKKVKGTFRHKIKECVGTNPNFVLIEKDFKNVLPCNEMLLLNEKEEKFLSLHPLVILENCDICKREEVFFYSKLKNDKLWYLNYETGHRIPTDKFLDDFRELVELQSIL